MNKYDLTGEEILEAEEQAIGEPEYYALYVVGNTDKFGIHINGNIVLNGTILGTSNDIADKIIESVSAKESYKTVAEMTNEEIDEIAPVE